MKTELTTEDRRRIEQEANNYVRLMNWGYHKEAKDDFIKGAEYATKYERELWIKQCEELIRTRNVMSEGYKLEINRLEAERSELQTILTILQPWISGIGWIQHEGHFFDMKERILNSLKTK